jgi:hypothetical protein
MPSIDTGLATLTDAQANARVTKAASGPTLNVWKGESFLAWEKQWVISVRISWEQ